MEYKIISGSVVEVKRTWMSARPNVKKPRGQRIAGNTSERKIRQNEMDVSSVGTTTTTGTSTAGTTTAPTYWYDVKLPLLKSGMTHDTVNTVQLLLFYCDCYDGDITGVMDEATVKAVKAYQTGVGLDADGEVGGLTWAALLSRR